IGASTAVFSIVDGVMLKPLPYPESDRLASVWSRYLPESGYDFPQFPLSPPEYFDYRDATTAMEDVAATSRYRAAVIRDDGTAISVWAATATASLFDVLRVPPALGRTFTAEEDVAGGPSVVVLGHGLWRRAFGADSTILGRTIRLDGGAAEVIGVMPEGFAHPADQTELWTPIRLDRAQQTNRLDHFLRVVGRLASGADLTRASTEMDGLMGRWEAEFPDHHTGHFLYAQPLIDDVVGDARPVLVALLGAVGFVLLIVCANVANLLLARGEARQRELAVRSALGAGRARLLRQFLAEGAVLSLAGALAGLALAYLAVDATLALGADSIPRAGSVAVDARVLLFSGAVALFTTLVFAAAPTTGLAVAEPSRTLRDESRSTTSSKGGLRLRNTLVAVQVALAVVVVIGAGLMVRSFGELTAVDPGFRAESALVADLSVPAADYPDADDVIAFNERLVERLRALPGARAATAVSTQPLDGGGGVSSVDFQIEGAPPPGPGEPAPNGDLIVTDADYLETMGIELVEGRFFQASDGADNLPVTVVNRRLARTFWPDERAVGKRIRGGDDDPWLTVVGVVDDVQYRTLADELRPAWYLPLAQMPLTLDLPQRSYSVAVRTTGDPTALARSLRRVVGEVAPTLPVIRLRPLANAVAESVAGPRFTMTVLGLFAAVALVLGAVGIYGVLAYVVARRTREFGIRMALGAGWRDLSRIVLGRAMRLVLVGLGVGLVGAALATRLLRDMLFGVSATDPVTFAVVAATVCLVGLAACLVPVRRALRADPAHALRAE
ncbi:MAG: ABC transporter permease, partial [Gemmatimonadota bacterium]